MELKNDAQKLTQSICESEARLIQLPSKPNRNEKEQSLAEQIFGNCRQLRSQFLNQHAQAVYDHLTKGFNRYLRLSELVFEAAEEFPGLVPTRDQFEIEQKNIQAHKEGLEIDQGIFFHGLLHSPKVGTHLMDAMLLPCPRALSLLEEFKSSGKIHFETILLEKRESSAYLTINNQRSLNAEDNCLVDDLETAVDLSLLDEEVTVGVLRGGIMTHPRYAGKRVFCAGINLTDLYAGKISFVDFLLGRELGYISKIAHGLLIDPTMHLPTRTIQKPWVAAVDSFAIGGGMQQLFVFDKIIAADDAYFILPAAQEGIVPGAANFRLSRITNSRLARQILLSGRKIFATDQEAKTICDEVIPSEKMDAAIESAVREFNNPAIMENRKMLSIAEESRDSFREYMAAFSYVQATRAYSKDVLEKIGSWAQARKNLQKIQETDPCV